jgi:DNA-binding MarR family transcriptional regulator
MAGIGKKVAKELHARVTLDESRWRLYAAYAIDDVSRLGGLIQDRMLKPHGITRAQGWILIHISWAPGSSLSRLAISLNLSKVAVAKLVERLVDRGLVTVEVDPTDRRSRRVQLTRAGRKMVGEFSAIGDSVQRVLWEGISDEQGAKLIEHFMTMKDRMIEIIAGDIDDLRVQADAVRLEGKV